MHEVGSNRLLVASLVEDTMDCLVRMYDLLGLLRSKVDLRNEARGPRTVDASVSDIVINLSSCETAETH